VTLLFVVTLVFLIARDAYHLNTTEEYMMENMKYWAEMELRSSEDLERLNRCSCFVYYMPVCPKCGKIISDKKWVRHQKKRCGVKHRKEVRPLVEHGAVPDYYWGTFND